MRNSMGPLILVCVIVWAQHVELSIQALNCPGTNLALEISAEDRNKFFFRRENTIKYLGTPEIFGEDPGESLFLTPYIRAGKIKQAQSLARVDPEMGGMPSYSGFLTVNEECGSNLFFWYFPAQEHSETAPLVTWLQGGPGASSMFGLFTELGPFNHFPEGLKNRQFSWNVKNNLVFFDQPVGTGFSFTTKDCFATNETMVGIDMYNALVQFLSLFPDLQKNKFILTGESYAGHYIPAIAHTIHTNNLLAQLKINLYGMMIGDGWTDPREQIGYAEYLYQTGLIDDDLKSLMKEYQKRFVIQVDQGNWLEAHTLWCKIVGLIRHNVGVDIYNFLPHPEHSYDWLYFLNSTVTRKSLHVGSLKFSELSNKVYGHLIEDMSQSVKPLVEQLLEHYPIVFYAGQVDVICGYPMMVNFLRSLKWSGQPQYLAAPRDKWYDTEGDLAGYVKGHHRLYDVMVRAAGHMVPADQPLWAFLLVNAFTSGNMSSLLTG